MYKIEDIKDVHIEITTRCQARCPMCPRRINGGVLNPLMTLTEIDLETFKNWFSIEFIQQLNSLFMCGNLGDPIIAKDCLEILQYLKEVNPNIRLSMHTNGSARSLQWWEQVAYTGTRVVFGIDGLADTHSLYRIDTDYDRIIDNARAFIQAGGYAEWHMLVFKHNEHQIEKCRELASKFGFKNFQIKHTTRFTDIKFPVLDDSGKTIYNLYPSTKTEEMLPQILTYARDLPSSFVVEQVGKCTINCKSVKWKQIYVAATGNVGPCCWMDFKEKLHKQNTRIDYMDKIGLFPNLQEHTLVDIFNSGYFDKISSTWDNEPVFECAKQCGNFDKSGAQFENRS
jgi:MoaA/NifB/PqqE/SkfB family radical SAM enzyme